MRKCLVCKEKKEVDEFYKSHKGENFTRASYCKPCQSEFAREWREKNLEKLKHYKALRYKMFSNTKLRRNNKYLSRYGINLEQYEQMLHSQDGVCKICLHPCRNRGTLSVDHCHLSGIVRGLLCDNCNNMLGRSGDSISILRRAADYLEFFEAAK